MKRSPLKRRTPLRAKRWGIERKTAIKRQPRRPKKGDDPEHLAWVRTLPCLALRLFPGHRCSSRRADPHHAGSKARDGGMGLKTPDRTSIPLCRQAHEDLHHGHGPFEGMDKAARRDWQDERIAEVLALRAATPAGALPGGAL